MWWNAYRDDQSFGWVIIPVCRLWTNIRLVHKPIKLSNKTYSPSKIGNNIANCSVDVTKCVLVHKRRKNRTAVSTHQRAVITHKQLTCIAYIARNSNYSMASRKWLSVKMLWICCTTFNLLYNLSNKSTTNRSNGILALAIAAYMPAKWDN